MKIVITGGGGFLGRRLAGALLADPKVGKLVLADVAPIQQFSSDKRIDLRATDLADPRGAEAIVEGADVIFHLAAVVKSGQAEAEFDSGMRVNLDATRAPRRPASPAAARVVFSSSLAVF